MGWITAAELSNHGKDSGDPWIAIGGVVYTVRDLLLRHPGGAEPLLRCAGGDGTVVFNKAGHGEVAKKRLEGMKVGVLAVEASGEEGAPVITIGSYVEACNLESEGNCNGWRGRVVAFKPTPLGHPGAVVSFPPPYNEVHLALTKIKQPDPDEIVTLRVVKEKGTTLGLCHQGGAHIIGGIPGHQSEALFNKYVGRWIRSLNHVKVEHVKGYGVHEMSDDSEVIVEIGGFVPFPGDRAEVQGKMGTVMGTTETAKVAIQLDDGSDVMHVASGEYRLLVTPTEKESPATWHSNRRAAMLAAHPEIDSLPKYQPVSLLIGLTVSLIHFATASRAANASWGCILLYAYTIGALCKAVQFAMGHEICHNTVSKWASNPRQRLWCLRLVNLPSMGCGLFNYYAHHHMGHHALLGSQRFQPAVDAFLEGREVDGDLLHSYTGQLRNVVWDLRPVNVFTSRKPLAGVHPVVRPVLILVRDSVIYVGHLMLMMLWTAMGGGLYLATLVLTCGRGVDRVNGVIGKPHEMVELGKQAVLMLMVLVYLGRGGLWDFARVCVYLSLSELFLSGFLLHPMGVYFLGVHKTAPHITGNVDSNPPCQPTQSCYASPLFSVLTCNLTHHTEHHDFPNLPWTALPRLREIAPEYYRCLQALPHPLVTMFRYYFGNEHWTYGCS